MALKKISFEYEDGSIKYLDTEQLKAYNKALAKLMSDANYNPFTNLEFKEYAQEFKLGRVYFALVEEVAKNTGAGYSKDSLHAALKPMLFSKIQDNLSNFKDNVFVASTKNLTHSGWVSIIEQFKEFVADIFGYVCK